MIWSPKDDSRAIAWVLSQTFPSDHSYVIEFDSSVSDNSVAHCSPSCSYWASGAILYGVSVRLSIATCVGSKAFSAFTQDTSIYLYVDELYSTIFIIINGVLGHSW